jgi:hypothetical protein
MFLSCSGYIALPVNYELERIWKVADMVFLKVLSEYLSGGTEKN